MKFQVVIGGEPYEIEFEDDDEVSSELLAATVQSVVLPTAAVSGSDSDRNGSTGRVYRSPIAGIVIRVHVAAGQHVQEDDPMLELEAMKMLTEIRAVAPGRLKSISVGVGAAVKANQVLLELE